MSSLDLDPRFEDADAFYKSLVNVIDDVDEEAGVGVLVRLVLILANHVRDEGVLERAIAEAARARSLGAEAGDASAADPG